MNNPDSPLEAIEREIVSLEGRLKQLRIARDALKGQPVEISPSADFPHWKGMAPLACVIEYLSRKPDHQATVRELFEVCNRNGVNLRGDTENKKFGSFKTMLSFASPPESKDKRGTRPSDLPLRYDKDRNIVTLANHPR